MQFKISQNEIQNATAQIKPKIIEHIVRDLDKYIRFKIDGDGNLFVIYGESESKDEASE
ncbi:MAG: hypothetical protein FWC96_04690 [Oscillospiraceae bacterium]|nr:hypothetical protein [Oscillospiraceae bacterium]